MNVLNGMIGKVIEIHLSGGIHQQGMLIDFGLDLIVIYNGIHYIYIPSGHIQSIRFPDEKYEQKIDAGESHAYPKEEEISYRKILMNSKGMFLQIFVTGNQSIHGYVTNVQADYFTFYSPVHQTLCIPLFHLKWLIPYPDNQTPYSLQPDKLPVKPASMKVTRHFEEQLKNMTGKIVVFDLGHDPDKIGLLNNIDNHLIELITAEQKSVFWNMQHIKMVQCPDFQQ